MRRRHYSIHTERSYCEWVKRYLLHFNMQSRDDLGNGSKKIERFLTFLAREKNIAPAIQNQAMNALVFFHKHVLKQTLDESINAERATKNPKVPVVLTRDETTPTRGQVTGLFRRRAAIFRHLGRLRESGGTHERTGSQAPAC